MAFFNLHLNTIWSSSFLSFWSSYIFLNVDSIDCTLLLKLLLLTTLSYISWVGFLSSLFRLQSNACFIVLLLLSQSFIGIDSKWRIYTPFCLSIFYWIQPIHMHSTPCNIWHVLYLEAKGLSFRR